MLGRNTPLDATVVYLASYPYLRRKTRHDRRLQPTPAAFTEIQKHFTAHLLRWCVQKSIVKNNDLRTELVPELDKNIASLSYIIHMHNFQHLVYAPVLGELLAMLKDNSSTLSTTALQQLTISLLSLYEPEFIHYHINRLYTAYATLPLPDADFSWAEIHRRYPFMWTVLTLHLVVKNYTELT